MNINHYMVAIQDQYQQGHRSAKLMESQGGFASSLASAYYKADMGNAIKLIAAFPDLFKQSPITAEAN